MPNSLADLQLDLNQESHQHLKKYQDRNSSSDPALIADRVQATRYFKLACLMIFFRSYSET
eukprot:145542-Pyramimonas_sp.AAC.1